MVKLTNRKHMLTIDDNERSERNKHIFDYFHETRVRIVDSNVLGWPTSTSSVINPSC